MRGLARPRRLIVLALVFAALGAGLAYGSWIAALLRAVVVLSTTLAVNCTVTCLMTPLRAWKTVVGRWYDPRGAPSGVRWPGWKR